MNHITRISTPFSEGTGLFCRVPWPEFSRAPWIIHPTHLSWFPVRIACPILRRFSWQPGSTASELALTDSLLGPGTVDLPAVPAYLLAPGLPTPGLPTSLRPSFARTHKYMNINMFSIRYVSRPLLRSRLTPGRLPLPGNPWVYGEQVFHLFYRYSCQHNHFSAVHHGLRHDFCPRKTLPYHLFAQVRSFGTVLSPVIFSAQHH